MKKTDQNLTETPISAAASPPRTDRSRCPVCGRRHRFEPRVLQACYPCRDRAARARAWAEVDPVELLDLCEVIGVHRQFCQNNRPPSYDDPGLAERIAKYPILAGGLFICGPVGSHKSHLLAARTVDAARRGFKSRFLKWESFLLEVRKTYRPNSTAAEQDVLDRYTELDYLGIDDLAVGRTDASESANSLRLAYMLFDGRYEQNKTTDITTNATPDELAQRFDERVHRRICELCTVYPMFLGNSE